ncbi:MAG: hypothetical protein KY456_11545 [Chloroflexi bacterium]|nr:hypothetical protein [Chloroflexota bacterium]
MPWQLLKPKTRAIGMAPLSLRLTGGTLALAFLLLCLPGMVLAHVDIDVGDGQYVMEVGFRDEPAYLGQLNAVHVSVEEYATGGTEPVEGLAATLDAEVSRDGQTLSVPLEPRGDGVYEGAFVPTAAGDYTFRVFGTIGDAAVDESVTSGPSTFNSVEPLSAIEFPVERPDAVQLRAEIADVTDAVGTARTLGIAGIAAGVLGLILAAVALIRAGRPKTEPASRPIEPSGKLIR